MCFEHIDGNAFFPGIFSHIGKLFFLKMAKKDVLFRFDNRQI